MQLSIKGTEVDFGDTPAWQKSTKSSPNTDNCIEFAFSPGGHHVAIRDSKDPDGHALGFDAGEWNAFLDGASEMQRLTAA